MKILRSAAAYLCLFSILLSSACSNTILTDEELDVSLPNIQEGHISAFTDSSFLVISDITREEARELSSHWLLRSGNEAVWYSVDDITPYQMGQLVRVEWETMEESYPGQAEAVRVQLIEEN